MEQQEKVLVVIDGDNLFHYFWNIVKKSAATIISDYVAGRKMLVKPMYFTSTDSLPEKTANSERDYQTQRIIKSGYFDVKMSHVEEYLFRIDPTDYHQPPIVNRGYSDADICTFIFEHISDFNTLMFFSPDPHFVKMIKQLRRMRKKVELYHSALLVPELLRKSANLEINMSKDNMPEYPRHILEIKSAILNGRWQKPGANNSKGRANR